MLFKKFARLIVRDILTKNGLEDAVKASYAADKYLEEYLIESGIPKHEILFCLSEHYNCPFAEFDESVAASYFLTMRLDMGKLKNALWFPLSVRQNKAEVIAYDPEDPAIVADIKATLKVEDIDFLVALPLDIIRIIEHNFDVNPGFPFAAGRTPLAKVRTFLADRRSLFACYRTSFAKGRTGLAFLRTGISFIAISLVFFRIFGIGYLTILEAALFIAGVGMTVDGVRWYIPARKTGKRPLKCAPTEPTWGSTVLAAARANKDSAFIRTDAVRGADKLRSAWNYLSPVMRRRFLASDRTDMAEERTTLACYRTAMARARTGLAFMRSGVAFAGLGIALLRQFHTGVWSAFDALLILTGIIMLMEGFYWYLPGRRAGAEGFQSVKRAGDNSSIWDFVFPPAIDRSGHKYENYPPLKPSHSPGIWATTGLALERTLLADRRNVMARLRTVMARSRTGMAFIRTGMSISAVGAGLLACFGTQNIGWTIFNVALALTGFLFIADGLYWHMPAEKMRRQLPYCFGEMEIAMPDYGKPVRYWGKAVF
ncbi:MAG: DUF202 domain-containing protein [Nitrospirae bacterium]|nr:DUF202 domain-containing protein [Nitrospirota bacterium]